MNEFEFLKNLKSKYSLDHVGDDCAILPLGDEYDLLLTSDMLVENVDFRLEWAVPEFLGHKALAVSLSDVAAMGGTPKWAMLSIGIPDHLWDSGFLDAFYRGWFELARKYGVKLVGGDISRVPGDLVVDSTVGGEVPKGKAFLRSAARPGDLIYVSGDLGGAAGGLKLLESGLRHSSDLNEDASQIIRKQLKPGPELPLANSLQQLGIVSAGIDLSDGLSSDLQHICVQSNVGAVIDSEKIPVATGLTAHFPPEECLEMALNGGEDFRLLFTAAPDVATRLNDLGVFKIGEITADTGQVFLRTGGTTVPLPAKGFRHF